MASGLLLISIRAESSKSSPIRARVSAAEPARRLFRGISIGVYMSHCPQCGNELSQERYTTGYAICECGWFDRQPTIRAEQKAEKKSIGIMIASSLAFVAFFGHMVVFGDHMVSIPVMKIQSLTGTLSAQGYESLAEACTELGNYSCAVEAYRDEYRVRGENKGLSNLGKLNMRLGKNDDAIMAYQAYVKIGGADPEATYLFGKLLETSGKANEAMAMYELAASKSEKTLPVLSTSAIVRLLIKQGQYEEAYDRILTFHESTEQANGYLNTELAQLENYFDSKPKHAGQKTGLKSQNGNSRTSRKALNGKRVARI